MVNVDAVVVCQNPKLAHHTAAMARNLSQVLKIAQEAVGIKGKTTESLGFAGRGEGIAAQAVALLVRTSAGE